MAKKKSAKSKNSATKVAPKAKSDSITDSINTEVIAEALSTANQPVLLKLCRLCEAKDGPFLNIFEADKVIAKKIDDLMPFAIEEHDDLPHKICFRCSAKVEELYEFVQKCIKTQDSLRKLLGKGASATKTKTRTLWEEKLNKSNMSNDDICDALIKKAMEGIKDIPLNSIQMDEDDEPILKKILKNDPRTSCNKDLELKKKIDNTKKEPDVPLVSKEEVEKNEQKVLNTRVSRTSNSEPLLEGLNINSKKTKPIPAHNSDSSANVVENTDRGLKRRTITKLEESPPEPEVQKEEEKPVEKKPDKKPFDIMDHISIIKVNGVGVLFQCKLCNRNFLKKEVVLSHACAKNGGPKQEVVPEYVPPTPPKMPVVKYINTKIDGLHSKASVVNEKPIVLDDEPAPSAPVKPKPKVGPASKVKKNDNESKTSSSSSSADIQTTKTSQINAPTVQFPTLPSLNSRYKLVSGPNNTFTLVEEKVADNTEYVSSDDSNSAKVKLDKDNKKVKSKQKNESSTNSRGNKPIGNSSKEKSVEATEASAPSDKPYPVGLIKRPVEHPNDYTPAIADSIAFTTPAMKKQSYTIVQTGNPSKLLISTKPKPEVEEVPKKRAKKQRPEICDDTAEQPFSVTLEDTTPPKDPGFFTFINVDPLLQPSYVLPTDNIIQESQISTSTAIQASASKDKDREKDKYSCNMCNEQFTREKKLLAHIQSHYSKMDEEDQLRERAQKKRGRKS